MLSYGLAKKNMHFSFLYAHRIWAVTIMPASTLKETGTHQQRQANSCKKGDFSCNAFSQYND